MQDVVSPPVQLSSRVHLRHPLFANIKSAFPSLVECAFATSSAALLIISFPNFDVAQLAWLALIPLLWVIAKQPRHWPTFFAGWIFGSVFFYGSCYWLTYSMIHFGNIPVWLAYAMLIPGALLLGVFPALFASIQAAFLRRWGPFSLVLAPVIWVALEWAWLQGTGQLWNALGYSQAYYPKLIGASRWGGVYAVGALLVASNAAITLAVVRRNKRASLCAATILLLVIAVIVGSHDSRSAATPAAKRADAVVIAIQPNVPMDLAKSDSDMRALTDNHFAVTEDALRNLQMEGTPRLVIWPESPMNFTYGRDQLLRDRLAEFARTNKNRRRTMVSTTRRC